MEEEVASEEEAEDGDSEEGASRCLARDKLCVTILRTSVALLEWYPTMDCICMHFFFL